MSTIHKINILNSDEYPLLDLIKKGQKTLICKKYIPIYTEMNIGDIITFRNPKNMIYDCINVKIISMERFEYLQDFLNSVNIKKALPWIHNNDIENAKKFYNKYTNEKQRIDLINKYGYAFLAITFELID